MKNSITMFRSSSDRQMMGFVVTSAGGGVVLIDGGYREDTDDMIALLRRLTGQTVPHLDAIFLTHPHNDHIGVFLELLTSHEGQVTFDKVYFSFPSEQYLSEDGDVAMLREFYSLLPRFADRAVFLFGGDRYAVRDMTADVIYTADYSILYDRCNNSSAVFRLDVGGSRVLITGDVTAEAGYKILAATDPARLRADVCQMSHHGQEGVNMQFYEAVRPKVCLWCTPRWLWENDVGGGYNSYLFETVMTRKWMDRIGEHTDVVMMDGTQTVDL